MNRVKLLAASGLLAVSPSAGALTMLCIPEVASVVTRVGDRFDSERLNTGAKFILSDESGRLQVKIHPDNMAIFTNCLSEWFCDGGDKFSGVFMREITSPGERSAFTAFWMTVGDKGSYANTAKGYCSQI
jgi:hypothetical protein